MRNADGLETMNGMKYLASAPDGETINSMVIHEGKLFVATNKHLYSDGMKYLASVPDGETINSMVIHKGILFVATNKHLYSLEDENRLEKINLTGVTP